MHRVVCDYSMKPIPLDSRLKEIIIGIQPFSVLPSGKITDIFNILDIKVYSVEKNEEIISQGDRCSRMYILLKGSLKVESIDVNGDNLLLSYLDKPKTFGLYPLFNEDNYFWASLTAAEDTVIATVGKDSLLAFLGMYPESLHQFLILMGASTKSAIERLLILTRKTVRSRIAAYLNIHKVKDSSISKMIHTQTQLADYLSVSRPALSTEINRMERDGIIRRCSRDHVQIMKDLEDIM